MMRGEEEGSLEEEGFSSWAPPSLPPSSTSTQWRHPSRALSRAAIQAEQSGQNPNGDNNVGDRFVASSLLVHFSASKYAVVVLSQGQLRPQQRQQGQHVLLRAAQEHGVRHGHPQQEVRQEGKLEGRGVGVVRHEKRALARQTWLHTTTPTTTPTRATRASSCPPRARWTPWTPR